MSKIIAVLGLPGSGKTEAIEYLMEKYGWPKVYFGDPTFEEIKRQGLEINPENEKMAREYLRQQFGILYYADEAIKKIELLQDGAPVILAESLYMWEEYKRFKEKFGDSFATIVIHASPSVRHTRLISRPVRPLTPEEAWKRDTSQIETLTQGGPIAMADHMIINEGSQEELRRNIDIVIDSLR